MLTSGDTLEGDFVTYTCSGAYQFSGGADELLVTCQENGLWEDVVQQCVIPDAGYTCQIAKLNYSVGIFL